MTWGPTLTPQQEALLDDQVDVALPTQRATLTQSRAKVVALLAELENLKDLHKVFYDWFHDVAGYYETELQWYNGDFISSPVTDSDLEDAINRAGNPRLFPDNYSDFEPKYIDELKGVTDDHAYDNEVCMHAIAEELADSLNAARNGTATSATTATLNKTDSSISVTAGTGTSFTVGADVYVLDTGGFVRAVFLITAKFLNSIDVTLRAWCGAGSIVTGSSVSDDPTPKGAGLNDTRDELVAYITSQRAALQNNDDDISYVGVAADIATAITNATATINNYNSAWTFAQLLTYLANRESYMTGTRLGEISQAVATASVGIYDRRYDWINYLINRKIGSWEKLARNESTIDYIDADIASLTEQEDSLEEWRSG